MNKKFTILTASYNCARYLPELVLSVIAQTYRPLEVILVNDASKDGTHKLIKQMSRDYEKAGIEFKYFINKKRLYCGSSYRLALKKATGSYFGVLDSDDALESFACKYIVKLYEQYKEVTWIYTQYNKYNRKMNRIIKTGWCRHPGKNSILYMEKKNINVYSHWRTFSNRLPTYKLLFKKGLRCCVDKHLGFRLEELGVGMFTNKVCYKYRTRNKGEKPIVHVEPLKIIREQVVNDAKRRRKSKNIKVYPILKHKNK